MTGDTLKAALYLEAVLPALAELSAQDASLRSAAAGSRPFAITLAVRGHSRRRLAFATDGAITTSTTPQPGDLSLWFPSAGQFLRTVSNRSALALPGGGWTQLTQLRRFSTAGARLDTLLQTRADAHLALHAWGSLLVALAAAASWLRHHPDGPATHARLGTGTVVFECPVLPAPLWLDLATLNSGTGTPASPVTVRIAFGDLATLMAELDNQLDAPAALGLGTLRITGYLPLAENLSLVMLKAGNLLRP
ncbi:hypothetical protein [Rariglobus hedericola]|uniref:SCP2 domain-containing protein n=1 Tax=Rariglobus hedericola TaxID=2597822 RepID=A0A556QJ61_9BACT|nr:hypothetical protein [Rariglobus hedericola]TSJ76680.1 hypothetical protein FPL22_11175 [Rariglobus hedericola]